MQGSDTESRPQEDAQTFQHGGCSASPGGAPIPGSGSSNARWPVSSGSSGSAGAALPSRVGGVQEWPHHPRSIPHGCKGWRRRDQGAAAWQEKPRLCAGAMGCAQSLLPSALVGRGRHPGSHRSSVQRFIWLYSLLLLQLVGPPFIPAILGRAAGQAGTRTLCAGQPGSRAPSWGATGLALLAQTPAWQGNGLSTLLGQSPALFPSQPLCPQPGTPQPPPLVTCLVVYKILKLMV